jgi:phospholipid/cholesterol/gamma-HCH transport system substrate-binding protein
MKIKNSWKQNYYCELATGCFVVATAAVVCLFTLLYLAGFWRDGGYVVYADFGSVAGVKIGDPVKIAGVRIGEVDSMDLRRFQARLGLRVRHAIRLHNDASASIESRSLLTGDKLVEIQPGQSPDLLQPGERIASTRPAYDLTQVVVSLINGSIGRGI